jgi:hypothetical protein
LLYTNDEQTEKKYKKTIPFTIASKIKTLEDKLNKVKDLHNENYKLLKKEINKITEDGKISHTY